MAVEGKLLPIPIEGLIQALNLDFLHALGLEIHIAGPSDLQIVDLRKSSTGTVLFGDEKLRDPEFLDARIAFLHFRRTQHALREMALGGDLYQIVPGRYCYLCGCTDLNGCRLPNDETCHWNVVPELQTNGTIFPGLCSFCAPEDEVES